MPYPTKTPERRAADGSRRRPWHHQQPKAVAGEPPMPDGLDEQGVAEWTRLAGHLREEQRLSLSDGPWLELTARTYSSWRGEADERRARLWCALYRALLNDGAMTPATRSRAAVPTRKPEESPIQKLMRQASNLRAVPGNPRRSGGDHE